ncbi:MAG: SGNH/GDSL hydrolase family protein [Anaerolineae bacterium]|nr:SGNH/GDSL hydrolase family protein [Anaerolineae bacterium]
MKWLSEEQLGYVLQFEHLEKTLEGLPGLSDEHIAALYGLDGEAYRAVRDRPAARARQAAEELVADPTIAACVDRLPFLAGETVVGLGDSITDDDQSWLEILRHMLHLRRAQDRIRVVNAGVSGDTTAHMITRFLDVVVERPDWILCLPGTNDARLHGRAPSKVLVSAEETARNLAMLRHYGASQTEARWVWITPAWVIEAQIERHWFLSGFEMRWRNRDLSAIAACVRQQPDPVIDLQAVFGLPPDPELLLDDGLHPSLAGQKAIVSTLVETMARMEW